MKKHTAKIFNRHRLLSNKGSSVQYGLNRFVPLHDFAAQGIAENISTIRRFYEDVAYLGPSISTFLEAAPPSKEGRSR